VKSLGKCRSGLARRFWTWASFLCHAEAHAPVRGSVKRVPCGLSGRLPDAHVTAAVFSGATVDMPEVLLRSERNRDEKGIALIVLNTHRSVSPPTSFQPKTRLWTWRHLPATRVPSAAVDMIMEMPLSLFGDNGPDHAYDPEDPPSAPAKLLGPECRCAY
jgi:hypothetical protein